MTNLRLRLAAAVAAVALFGFLAVANFVPEETRAASPLLPDDGLRLGLDLRGGIHWVLGVKLEMAEGRQLEFLAGDLKRVAENDANLSVDGARVDGTRLVVDVVGNQNAVGVRDWAGGTDSLESLSDDGTTLVYRHSDPAREEVRRSGMDQVLEVLRGRIADP